MKIAVTLSSQIYQLGALRSALAAAAMLVVAYARSCGADKSGLNVFKQARICARLTRSLIARSVHNHRVARKNAMQANPARRAQVLRDLGGEAGLVRWERRLEKAQKRARARAIFDAARARHKRQATFHETVIHRADAAHKSALLARQQATQNIKIQQIMQNRAERYPNLVFDPCKLDQTGVFRLAAIKRGPRRTAAKDRKPIRSGVLRREGKVRAGLGLFAPIPLVPKDLRVRVRAGEPDWGRPIAAVNGAGFTAHAPPKGKPP